MRFDRDVLRIDPAQELEKLSKFIAEQLNVVFRRKGIVIGLSGGIDIEPLAHLYKNQVYQLSEYLHVIPEIIARQPSPDTFSLPVSDQEFFFRIPFDRLDHLLYAWEHEIPVADVARVLDLSEDAVQRAYNDFASKHRATAHLRELAHALE